MNQFFCDVCGHTLPRGYKTPDLLKGASWEEWAGVVDVCESCRDRVKNLDRRVPVLDFWRKQVEAVPTEAPLRILLARQNGMDPLEEA